MEEIEWGRALITIAGMILAAFLENAVARKVGWLDQKKRRLERAEWLGHVAVGHLAPKSVHRYTENRGQDNEYDRFSGAYEYEVDGASYRRVETGFSSTPPETVLYYYDSSPQKAYTAAEAGGKSDKLRRMLFLVIPLATGCLIYNLFG